MGSITTDEVLLALHSYEDGAQMADLEVALSANRRTILRYLNELIDGELVRREGAGRSTRYVLERRGVQSDEVAESLVHSKEAREALQRVRAPLTSRQPVGYDPSFLLDYEPGTTWMLGKQLRDQLHDVGRLTDQVLPAGTYARRILDRLLIDLSWNSSRLEGNTYSLLETERLLEAGVEASERDPRETQMILNHKAAIELLVEEAEEIDFDRLTILNLHALLSENLVADPMDGGRLRQIAVRIGGSVFEPLQNPHHIAQYFDEFLSRARAIDDPFEQSFFALVHLPYLQPFIDVNKRVSRLAANIPFVRQNLSPLSFIDVAPQSYAHAMLAVYEQNDVSVLRDVYVWAYERSAARYQAIRQSMGEPDTFRLRYRAQLKDVVAQIIRAREPAASDQRLAEDAAKVPEAHHQRFVEIVLEELTSLHEGNFRRYPVRPSEFRAWKSARE